MSEASYLSLYPGRDDLFAVVHHYDGPRLEFTAQRITAPDQVLSRILIDGRGSSFEGSQEVWQLLPRYYVAYYAQPGESNYYLFTVTGPPQTLEMQSFDWYNDSYDKDYQGIIGVTDVPGTDLVIVSVQRDSSPVLYDPSARKAVRKIQLAGRSGNPTLRFRQTASEVWADDYDTLLRLNPHDWAVMDALQLQRTDPAGIHLFIGGFAFNRDESLCAVARPYSSDVVALDTGSFRVTHHAPMENQPLDVALLSDGRVFARAWQTGDLLQSRLR